MMKAVSENAVKVSILQKITKNILVIVLAIDVILGAVGIISLSIQNNNQRRMYQSNMLPLSVLYNVADDFNNIRVSVRDYVADVGNRQVNVKTVNNSFSDIQKQVQLYKGMVSSPKLTTDIYEMEKNISDYQTVWQKAQADYKAGHVQDAVTDLNYTITYNTLPQAIQDAYRITLEDTRAANQASQIFFFAVIGVNLVILLLCAWSAIRFGTRIARKITGPIRQVTAAAEELARGNLDIELDLNTGDETEQLAAAFKKSAQSIRAMESDVQTLMRAAVAGELSVRADVSRHDGKYRQIIEGFNGVLQAIEEPLTIASVFLQRLSAGERQEPMEIHFRGYYAVLLDNLNQVYHAVATLNEETEKLADAGKRGDLQARADVRDLKGTYAQVVESFNEAFEGIQRPMDDIIERLNNIKNGSDVSLDNPYTGYPARLTVSLLEMYQALHSMLEESEKLSAAGRRGDLSVRGCTDKLFGGQTGVIEGFNDMLDSIAAPVHEAIGILGKMTVHDFQTPMSEDYHGEMKTLAQSVNTLRQRLRQVEAVYVSVAQGDLKMLEEFREVGRLSENDQLLPAAIRMMQSIQELISESDRISTAARHGDLSVRGDVEHFEGAYADIIEGMNRTMEAFDAPIQEIMAALRRLADGNLTEQIETSYSGRYGELKQVINSTVLALNSLLASIKAAGEEVAAGAAQISSSSQLLSRGATEQASSVEELTATLAEVAEKTKLNAEKAANSNLISGDQHRQVEASNSKMQEMLESMENINDASMDISKIIKVIDDIAFQTNILALNAAVEAARAGQYGKGFAVVADEVRNLAAKSAQAAKSTNELIAGSIEKIKTGRQIANETAGTLRRISESAQKAHVLMDEISASSNEQSTAIAQINLGITQVSDVVQTNSATAEETAASSEELSGQANALRELIGRFQL